MKTFKHILLAAALSFTMINASKELSIEIDEDKILQAVELLQCMEDATFEHQEECSYYALAFPLRPGGSEGQALVATKDRDFKDTEYCTCDGDYLALIAYNRIVQAKQLLCDAIEVKLDSVEGE